MGIDDLKLYLLDIKKYDNEDLKKVEMEFQCNPDEYSVADLSYIKGRIEMVDDILKQIKNNK